MLRGLLITLFLLIPTLSFALPYWATPPDGTIYHYENDSGESLDVRYSQVGDVQHREYLYDEPGKRGGEYYLISDVLIYLMETYSQVPGEEVRTIQFTPHFAVDRIGSGSFHQWLWEGTCDYGTSVCNVVFWPRGTTTPMGYFPVMIGDFRNFTGLCTLPYDQLFLHEHLGPVRMDEWGLVGIDNVVAVEESTWGNVKSMYR